MTTHAHSQMHSRRPFSPFIDLSALLSQPNPSIDLRLDEYESTTRNFMKAVSAYSKRAVEELNRRKSEHAMELKRCAERKVGLEAEVTTCKVREIQLMEVLEKEQSERTDSEASISELKRQFASLKEKCASVDVEIEQYRIDVDNLKREKGRDASILETYASKMYPELRECEERLKCVIQGVEKDKLLILFTHIDPNDLGREFSFILDVSARSYSVPVCTPLIRHLPILLDQLNATRDSYAFIKNVRRAFVEMVDS